MFIWIFISQFVFWLVKTTYGNSKIEMLPLLFSGTFGTYEVVAISTDGNDIVACTKNTEGRFEMDFPVVSRI